jgi:hypothetical protein
MEEKFIVFGKNTNRDRGEERERAQKKIKSRSWRAEVS